MSQYENLSGSALIQKLAEISDLFQNAIKILGEVKAIKPKDNYKRNVKVPPFPGNFEPGEQKIWINTLDHKAENAYEVVEAAHRKIFYPKEPKKPTREMFLAPKPGPETKLGCGGIGTGLMFVFFLLSVLVNTGRDDTPLGTLLIIALIFGAAFAFFLAKMLIAKTKHTGAVKAARLAFDREQEAIAAEYARQKKEYEDQCAEYEKKLQAFMAEYNTWRKLYLDSLAEEEQIQKKLEADRKAAYEQAYEQKYIPAANALFECNDDLVATEYMSHLDTIIDLLRTGRADSLKEAINLYEDIAYKEKQLQIQRDAEAQRRREEEQRRQDEARYHQEQMAFQKEQERQRKYEAEQELRLKEQQHKDEMKMQEARMKQEAAIAKASRQKRCENCIHKSNCRVRYTEGAYNCTGFSPNGGY